MAQARAENAVSGTGDRLKNSALAVIEEVTATQATDTWNSAPAHDPMNDSLFLRAMGIKL